MCFSRSTAYNTFQFEKSLLTCWKVLDTIILWQDAGPCCEQTRAAFEVGLSLDQGQGVYSGRSDVVCSSHVRLCHTCIIDVMKWKHFPRYLPFVRGIRRFLVNFSLKVQWRGASMFTLIGAWTNGYVNNRDAWVLRGHRAHYYVTAMPFRNRQWLSSGLYLCRINTNLRAILRRYSE